MSGPPDDTGAMGPGGGSLASGAVTLAAAPPLAGSPRAPTLADFPQLAARGLAAHRATGNAFTADAGPPVQQVPDPDAPTGVAWACAALLRWQRLDQLAHHAVEMRAAFDRLGPAERQALPAREALHLALGTLAEDARKLQAALIPPPALAAMAAEPVFPPATHPVPPLGGEPKA